MNFVQIFIVTVPLVIICIYIYIYQFMVLLRSNLQKNIFFWIYPAPFTSAWWSRVSVVTSKKIGQKDILICHISLLKWTYIFFNDNLTYSAVFKNLCAIFNWLTQMYYMLTFWPGNIIYCGDIYIFLKTTFFSDSQNVTKFWPSIATTAFLVYVNLSHNIFFIFVLQNFQEIQFSIIFCPICKLNIRRTLPKTDKIYPTYPTSKKEIMSPMHRFQNLSQSSTRTINSLANPKIKQGFIQALLLTYVFHIRLSLMAVSHNPMCVTKLTLAAEGLSSQVFK